MAQNYLPVVGITVGDLRDTYGANRSGGRSHKGIDIFAAEGTGVVAVADGVVVKAGDSGGLGGNRVWVKDDAGVFHYYAHLQTVSVKQGQKVSAGQRLGTVGKTGNAKNTPAHLHYSVNKQGSSSETGSLNPYEYLTGARTASANPTDDDVLTGRGEQQRREEQAAEPQAPQQAGADVMAQIMASISKAASSQGGRVLDTSALFGGIFGDDDEHEHDHLEGVV